MKKALSFFLFVAGSVMIASAQINVGGTIGGVPITAGTGNGGTLNIGVTANQGQVNGGALFQLLAVAQTLVSRLVPFAVGVAVITFFWFLIMFIMKGTESAEKRAEGLKGMGFSILALFVMVSVWGLIGAIGGMLGVGQGGSVPIPGVPVPTN